MNNNNAALVVEPYLLKAFKLLHSKEKNSAEKLKAMLDEAIRSKNEKNGGGGGGAAACIPPPPPITCFTTAGSKLASLSATPKGQQTAAARIKGGMITSSSSSSGGHHIFQVPKAVAPPGGLGRMNPAYLKPVPLPLAATSTVKIVEDYQQQKKRKYFFDTFANKEDDDDEGINREIKDSPDSPDMEDTPAAADLDSLIDANLAQEVMKLCCVTCNGLDQKPFDELVECQQCNDMYHQKCHRPPISDRDVNDPFKVFYCCYCSKKPQPPPSSSSSQNKRQKPSYDLF